MVKYIKYVETYGLSQNPEDSDKLNVKYPGTDFNAVLLGTDELGEVDKDYAFNLIDEDTLKRLYDKYKDIWSGKGRFIYSRAFYIIEAVDSKGFKFREVRSSTKYEESINQGYRLATQEESKYYHENILPGFHTGIIGYLMIKEGIE